MPSTYSPTLRIELIGAGEQDGTWGTTTNSNLGSIIEQAITGVQAITFADANYTLTAFNGLPDESRNAVLVLSGTNTATRQLIAPSPDKLAQAGALHTMLQGWATRNIQTLPV